MAKKKRKSQRALREVLSFSVYLLLILLAAFLIINFVARKTVVVGESMEPTYHDGDQLILEKVSYYSHAPRRFDVVVFPYRFEQNTLYVKRIIGLPGETVRIDSDGTIYINDKPLKENFGKEVIADPGTAAGGITLEPDTYFVLGDNRNNSVDSRFFQVGAVDRKDILGRVWFKLPLPAHHQE